MMGFLTVNPSDCNGPMVATLAPRAPHCRRQWRCHWTSGSAAPTSLSRLLFCCQIKPLPKSTALLTAGVHWYSTEATVSKEALHAAPAASRLRASQ
jgi:hypothetical protein